MYNQEAFATDTSYETHTIKEVREVAPEEGKPTRWELSMEDHLGFCFEDAEGVGIPPAVGETIRCYGRGMGYPIRGVAIVDKDGNPRVYRYHTEDESQKHREEMVAARKKEESDKFQENLSEFTKAVMDLPPMFRARMERFLQKPGWGAEFGNYELFSCREALKILEVCKTPDQIRAFHGMKWEEQKKMVPTLDDGHSGNTFGMACKLALIYVEKPEMLPLFHGALCPLVGCQNYGCYAASLPQNG